MLLSGILIAYNTGANELATILGPVIHSGLMEQMRASLIGSLFVFLGAVILSHRVIETIGKGITTLDPYSGFAAQFGAGICVMFFTILGMPISTTYCIIGGISGVGMSKGMETVKLDLIKKIIANWFLAPSLAFLISFLIMKAVILIFCRSILLPAMHPDRKDLFSQQGKRDTDNQPLNASYTITIQKSEAHRLFLYHRKDVHNLCQAIL